LAELFGEIKQKRDRKNSGEIAGFSETDYKKMCQVCVCMCAPRG